MIFTAFARHRLQNIFKFRLHTRGWFSVVMIIGVTFLLLVSFGRVITNAKNNFEVYQYEQSGLVALQGDNDELQRELDYYQSFEYKRLYARDFLHLAEPGETLYKIVGSQTYYEINEKVPNFVTADTYSFWWGELL
jgi:cell division protein FtsB